MSEKVRTRTGHDGAEYWTSADQQERAIGLPPRTRRTERDRGNRKNNAVRRPSLTTPTRGPSQNPHTR